MNEKETGVDEFGKTEQFYDRQRPTAAAALLKVYGTVAYAHGRADGRNEALDEIGEREFTGQSPEPARDVDPVAAIGRLDLLFALSCLKNEAMDPAVVFGMRDPLVAERPFRDLLVRIATPGGELTSEEREALATRVENFPGVTRADVDRVLYGDDVEEAGEHPADVLLDELRKITDAVPLSLRGSPNEIALRAAVDALDAYCDTFRGRSGIAPLVVEEGETRIGAALRALVVAEKGELSPGNAQWAREIEMQLAMVSDVLGVGGVGGKFAGLDPSLN